jgi:hypothetical protein
MSENSVDGSSEQQLNDSTAPEEIVEKKGPRSSAAWRYFGYLKSDEQQRNTLCKICRRNVATKTGNTSNLFQHLRQCHPLEHAQLCKTGNAPSSSTSKRKPYQQTIMSALSSIAPYEKTSKRHKDVTHAITQFLAKGMLPIRTVEREEFKNLMRVIDPRYQLPGRKHFSQTAIPHLNAECRGMVERDLRAVAYFATTSDLWSSRTSEPYLSLTAHYIDQDWAMKSKCLQTAYFPEDHTAEAIASGLTESLGSWGLSESKQVCITTDSGANIVKATTLNNWTRLQCLGHRLHSAVGKLNSRIAYLNCIFRSYKYEKKRMFIIIYFLNYYLRKKTRTFYNESQGLLFIMFIRPPCFIYISKINLPPQKIINWYSNYAGFMPLSINLKNTVLNIQPLMCTILY